MNPASWFLTFPPPVRPPRPAYAKDDVIRAGNGQPVRTVDDLWKLREKAAGKKLTLSIIRGQNQVSVEVQN